MKSGIRSGYFYFPVWMLLAATLLLNGCAIFGKGGPFRGGEPPRLVATLQSVQEDYEEAALETAGIEEALSELDVSDVLDLEQAYQAFSESAERIQETGKRLIVHADEMHFSGASYLVESGKSPTACVYPRLREPEDSIAAEYGAYFNAIADKSWQVKRALRAYQFDVSQIRNYLSTNLTLGGVEAMAPVIRKAQVDGDSLEESLRQALAAIELAKVAKARAALPSP
ncbi:MAG: hypothetical protein A2075_18860 [Geobacteraceae bacterium GWC2_58_44]|nr:MAG: hypothetical protein A2075_18860 [Geobacteraceae bacterium GWC2_58_44]HBG05674.1 hypothetical protein [Geobacter sp.]